MENIIKKCPFGCSECLNSLENNCTKCDFKFVAILNDINKALITNFSCKLNCPKNYYYFGFLNG